MKSKNTMPKFINYSSYHQAEDIKRLKFITTWIGKSGINKPSILDIGCGNGNISFQLANTGYNVKAIDISEEAIAEAQIVHNHANISYEVKSIENFDPAIKFDIIICSEVLEHLQDPFSMMQKIKSYLSKEGYILITIPNGHGPRESCITRPVQKTFKNEKSTAYKFIHRIKRLMGYSGVTIQSASHSLMHIQFFSLSDIYAYAKKLDLDIIYKGASNFIEKVFPFSLLAKHFITLQKIDCKIADMLPLRWCSGFFFVLKHD